MNISRVHAGYTLHAPRRCEQPVRPADRNEGRCEARTAEDAGPYDFYCPSNIESPVQPPWRVLPWPRTTAVRAAHAVKVVPCRTDLTNVGRTLDVFV